MNKRTDRIASALLLLSAVGALVMCVCGFAGMYDLAAFVGIAACYVLVAATFVVAYSKKG